MRPNTNTEGPVVLVVGGWSPGPLLYLQQVLASRPSVMVVEPRNLPMPPFPGSWCCHPMILTMMAICGTFLWLACVQHRTIAWNLLALVASVVSIRLLAAVAVRTSIQVSAQSCLEATQQYDGNVILLGFSWGGAVSFRRTLC
jgi:pimeloyl-ACP methyl ester carboxylesterase